MTFSTIRSKLTSKFCIWVFQSKFNAVCLLSFVLQLKSRVLCGMIMCCVPRRSSMKSDSKWPVGFLLEGNVMEHVDKLTFFHQVSACPKICCQHNAGSCLSYYILILLYFNLVFNISAFYWLKIRQNYEVVTLWPSVESVNWTRWSGQIQRSDNRHILFWNTVMYFRVSPPANMWLYLL